MNCNQFSLKIEGIIDVNIMILTTTSNHFLKFFYQAEPNLNRHVWRFWIKISKVKHLKWKIVSIMIWTSVGQIPVAERYWAIHPQRPFAILHKKIVKWEISHILIKYICRYLIPITIYFQDNTSASCIDEPK